MTWLCIWHSEKSTAMGRDESLQSQRNRPSKRPGLKRQAICKNYQQMYVHDLISMSLWFCLHVTSGAYGYLKKTLLKLYVHIDERSKKNIHPNCLLHRKFPGEKYQAHSLSTWALRFVPSSPSIKLSTPSVPSAVAFFTGPQMDVSENSGTPKSSILIGFSIIFTIHFGVPLLDDIRWNRTSIRWQLLGPLRSQAIFGSARTWKFRSSSLRQKSKLKWTKSYNKSQIIINSLDSDAWSLNQRICFKKQH